MAAKVLSAGGYRPAGLPADLLGPVRVQLTRSVRVLPGADALPGGCVYEPRWDGCRGLITRTGTSVHVWSRHGKDVTGRFSDVAEAAAGQLPDGCVVDGELVVRDGDGNPAYAELQRRLVATPATARGLTSASPASFIAFDLLAVSGDDLRGQPWTARRDRLESLSGWESALLLSPVSGEIDDARRWLGDPMQAPGSDGVVAKGAGSFYEPDRRSWLTVGCHPAVDVVVGGVIGPMDRPEILILGRYRDDDLLPYGRTVRLTERQSAELGALFTRPQGSHPWPDDVGIGRWPNHEIKSPLTKVAPVIVVEVAADRSVQPGQWRYPLLYVRHRPDLDPFDIDPIETDSGPAWR